MSKAIRGEKTAISETAVKVQELILAKVGRQERAQESLVAAFVESKSYNEAIERFNRMANVIGQLTDKQVARIIAAYHANDQLNTCAYLHYSNRLKRFIEAKTGIRYSIENKQISQVKIPLGLDEDVPF